MVVGFRSAFSGALEEVETKPGFLLIWVASARKEPEELVKEEAFWTKAQEARSGFRALSSSRSSQDR